MSKRILVLFNLKDGVSRETYEDWARTRDIPNVNKMDSVDGFEIFRATGLLFSEASPPYAYVEVLDVNDMDQFGEEASSETMQAVAAEFRDLTTDLVFVDTEQLK